MVEHTNLNIWETNQNGIFSKPAVLRNKWGGSTAIRNNLWGELNKDKPANPFNSESFFISDVAIFGF